MDLKDIENIKASVKSGEDQLDKLNAEIDAELSKVNELAPLTKQKLIDFQNDRNKMIKFAKENNRSAVEKFAIKLGLKWQ